MYDGLVLIGLGAGAYLAGRYAPLAAVALVLTWVVGKTRDGDSAVPLAFTLVAPYLAGLALRDRTRLVAALGARTRELEREQETFARLAVQHERARIACELHDIVAHHVAVMVVQAGAGRMAAESETCGRRAERFAGIRDAGAEALTELARLFELLGADRDTLPRLLERARAAGLHVRYDGPGELDDLALRILQEALTNALKHAPGADVEIDARAGVVVRDHGARTTPTLAATGAGLGLTGLRERVAAAGGTLAAGPAPGGGWELRATTPTEVAQDRH